MITMWIYYNPNRLRSNGGDCTIRALCKALDLTWQEAFWDLAEFASEQWDMPSINSVWGEYLQWKGFVRRGIPDTCPLCYTIKDFCRDNPRGLFVLGTGSHVVTVIDGDYYDTWDSGDKSPVYVFRRG